MTAPAPINPIALPQGPIVVLLNVDGGTVARIGHEKARRQIANAFSRQHGRSPELLAVRGLDLEQAARARIAASATGQIPAAIVAAGGDGTVGALAQLLAGSDIPLGILPLGTRNHFARDLGLPLDLAEAVAVIADGNITEVDLGEVNGRVFVNNSSIGLYPELVRDRNRQRRKSRRRKWLAMALALVHILRRPPVRRLRIEAEGWVRPQKTPFAFIGNNRYVTDLFVPRHRTSLAGGELCLFIATPQGFFGTVRLLLRAALGRLDHATDFDERCVRELVIRLRRRRVRVSLDGEVVHLHSPLHYHSRPLALRVLTPLAGTGG